MANALASTLQLQERVSLKSNIDRALHLLVLFLLLSLLFYRSSSLRENGFRWITAFICESWFTFIWFTYLSNKWSPVIHKTFPHRLSKRMEDLPAVDVFVTTADPKMEPPIMTVNTVLSLMALEYPASKLACYVSDDGGSPLTYFALTEGCKFAKIWVLFCKKYNIPVRAPFAYFTPDPPRSHSPEFLKEWKFMKNEYENLCKRIEDFDEEHLPYHLNRDLAEFSGIERNNHQSIVKVIWENKENSEEGIIPYLVYIAREKRPSCHHHYKAGAMNVLTRVSGVMTNAPFTLNVDCDMFANNPEIIRHAMCLLLGFEKETDSGFVQSPQQFYRFLKHDPFGNQVYVLQRKNGLGVNGIQGPYYAGTGAFHRRKIIYGATPEDQNTDNNSRKKDRLAKLEKLERKFGNTRELIESVVQTFLENSRELPNFRSISSKVEVAKEVAGCTYEFNTSWGKEIGWAYGGVVEDVLTGLRIHSLGWKSVYCWPNEPPFLGSAPTGPGCLIQYKRWSTGLLEVLVNKQGPITCFLKKRLRFRQCLAYFTVNCWALRSIFELSYSLIPAYCLLADKFFMPKPQEVEIWIPVALLLSYIILTLKEYLDCGLSIHAWYNNCTMTVVYALTAWLLGFFSAILKFLGISQTIFELTDKDSSNEEESGKFTFDSSPVFISGTAFVIIHITAVTVGLIRRFSGGNRDGGGAGIGEFVCSLLLLVCFWSFVKGLFGKGSYGIPRSIIWRAVILEFIFLFFCWWSVN